MHNIIYYSGLIGLGLWASVSSVEAADVNCTKAPNCATLGYTKTSTDCPKGGVKCPFDSSKMFCLKNTASYNFQITKAVKLYDVVYHDGTTSSATSVSGKTPIGLVYHVEPDGTNMHGLIMSLEQPVLGTRQEAIDYCANYVVKGTNVGDWRLPNVTEMLRMTNEYSLGKLNTKYWDIQQKLPAIMYAEPLVYGSYAYYYYQPNYVQNPKYFGKIHKSSNLLYYGSDTSDWGSTYAGISGYSYNSNYSQYQPYVHGYTTQSHYWTISDYKSGSRTYYYYVRVYYGVNNWVNYDASKTLNAHFRCIMQF